MLAQKMSFFNLALWKNIMTFKASFKHTQTSKDNQGGSSKCA